MVYLPTFGSFMGQMLVNIPYMDPMGIDIGKNFNRCYQHDNNNGLSTTGWDNLQNPQNRFGGLVICLTLITQLVIKIYKTQKKITSSQYSHLPSWIPNSTPAFIHFHNPKMTQKLHGSPTFHPSPAIGLGRILFPAVRRRVVPCFAPGCQIPKDEGS